MKLKPYLTPSSCVIIDICVVSKLSQSGIAITPITMIKKQKINLECLEKLPRISLGSRILDNQLLSHILAFEEEKVDIEEEDKFEYEFEDKVEHKDVNPIYFDELIQLYSPNEVGFDKTLFTNLI